MTSWSYPEYASFLDAIKHETGSVRERALGEVFGKFSQPTTPEQDLALAGVWMEWAIEDARCGLQTVLEDEFAPFDLLGVLALPEEVSPGRVPALDAYEAARLAAPALTAKKRRNRIAAFREAAEFFGRIADGLEERLNAGNY